MAQGTGPSFHAGDDVVGEAGVAGEGERAGVDVHQLVAGVARPGLRIVGAVRVRSDLAHAALTVEDA